MPERDLDERLDAVERALADEDTDLTDLRERGDVADIESQLDDIESRLEELEAGLEAVRGYAGNVRAVNREVERRASAALAKAETVEAAVDAAARPDGAPAGVAADRARTARAELDPHDETRSGGRRGRADAAADDGPRKDGRGSDGQRRGGQQRGGQRSDGREADRRPNRGQQGAATDGGESTETDSQTEQFIERVRDAL